MANKDQSTGMPEVPEGYFFRVKFGEFEPFARYRQVRVQLRRKRSIGSSVVASQFADLATYDQRDIDAGTDNYRNMQYPRESLASSEYERAVYYVAEWVLESHNESIERQQRNQDRDRRAKELAGDYPPKKLGG